VSAGTKTVNRPSVEVKLPPLCVTLKFVMKGNGELSSSPPLPPQPMAKARRAGMERATMLWYLLMR
jgi:hypothetical protein